MIKQELIETDDWEVLTSCGWKNFEGVIATHNRDTIKIDGLECTPNHLVKVGSDFVRADSLKHTLGNSNVVVYDLWNVDGHEYITNNLTSHNCDEFAFVPVNEQEEFFASTYPTISSGQTTKIIITSTPNGMDMFYRMWMDAIEGRSDFKHMTIHWSAVPGRDEKWYEETIRNIGEEKFKVEYGGEFSGATGTLISGSKLKQLRQSTPINTWNNVRFYDEPHEGHQYVMTVDCSQGVGGDSSAFSVIDVTGIPYVQVATFYDNNISPLMFPDVIVSVAKMFNNAYVLCEVNDIGHKVAYIIQAELEYEYLLTCSTKGRNGQCVSGGFGANTFLGVKTTSAVKKIGCSTLKKMIESDKLIIKDSHTITELFSFISYPNGTYAAEKGQHDDSVMTLVIFSWLSLDDFYKDVTNQDVRKNMLQDIDSSEDMPFGFFNDGETIIDISPASRVNTFGDEIFRF